MSNTVKTINNSELLKAVKTITNAELKAIINNNNIDIETLNEAEKHSVLIYRELLKAVKHNEAFTLDCNYTASKNVSKQIYLVDYYRLAICNTCIQVYCKHLNSENVSFNVYTSCKEAYREALTALDFVNDRNKTFKKMNVKLDSLAELINSVCDIITAKHSEAEKQKQSEAQQSKQNEAKQSEAQQSKAKQSKQSKQSEAQQSEAQQSKAKQSKQSEAKQNKAKQSKQSEAKQSKQSKAK